MSIVDVRGHAAVAAAERLQKILDRRKAANSVPAAKSGQYIEPAALLGGLRPLSVCNRQIFRELRHFVDLGIDSVVLISQIWREFIQNLG